MKISSALAILPVWIISASAPACAQVGLADARRGQELAARLCSGCHIVSPGSAATANPDIPTFAAIAGRADTTPERLAGRIIIPHPAMPGVPLTIAEIRDIVAYLRVLDNPGDSVSMRRILNTPRRGIGDRAEACVAVYAVCLLLGACRAENRTGLYATIRWANTAGLTVDQLEVSVVLPAGGAALVPPTLRPAQPTPTLASPQTVLAAYRPALFVITGVAAVGALVALSGLRRETAGS